MHPNHQAALQLAAAGIKSIACYYDPSTGKKPPLAHKDHIGQATDDPKMIDFWFNPPKGGWQMPGVFVKSEHILIGLPTGAHSGFDVLDIDVKQDVDGHNTIPGWERLAMVIVETPTGGHHLYYRHQPKLRLKNEAGQVVWENKRVTLPGVDIRTTGGYVILPGSTLPDGREYRWHTGNLVTSQGKRNDVLTECPLELITMKEREEDKAHKQVAKRKQRAEVIDNGERLERRAREWVAKMAAEVAEAPAGTRDETLKKKLYATACVVKAGLMTEEEYVAIFWSAVQSCGLDKDGVTAAVLDKKVLDGLDAGKDVPLPAFLNERDQLKDLNDRYFVLLNESNKALVGEWVWDSSMKRRTVRLQKFGDFANAYCNRVVRVGEETQELGRAWLKSPSRTQYHSLTFHPNGPEVDELNRLNLWRGFGYQASPGSWRRINRHVWRVLAKRDRRCYEFIVKWAAWCVQNPGKPAGVALVFQGDQGVGKGAFASTLVKLFGSHGMHVASTDQFAGRFNRHLREVCLLFADEAISPDNRASVSRMKAILTEDTLAFEGKGLDVVNEDNHVKLVIASNEEWVAPVDLRDRRFAVFAVSDEYIQSKAYFTPLFAEINEPANLCAMLHDLLNLPLGDWHPRDNIPQTEARDEQIEVNRDPWEVRFEELLSPWQGRVLCSDARKLTSLPEDRWEQKHNARLGATMKRLGWKRKKCWVRTGDGPAGRELMRFYVKGESEDIVTYDQIIVRAARAVELDVKDQFDSANSPENVDLVRRLLERSSDDDE